MRNETIPSMILYHKMKPPESTLIIMVMMKITIWSILSFKTTAALPIFFLDDLSTDKQNVKFLYYYYILVNLSLYVYSVQFGLSVMSDSLDHMNHSTPGLPVHHQLPESTQTNVH